MTVDVLMEYGIHKNDGIFSYRVPQELASSIMVGKRVFVPMNKNTVVGFVMAIHKGKFLKETTLSSLISCYQVMFPKAYKASHKNQMKCKTETYLMLHHELSKEDILQIRGQKQRELLELLSERKEIKKSLVSSSVATSLLQKGFLREEQREVYRFKQEHKSYEKHALTKDQQQVVNEVLTHLQDTKTYLLHGVTGSGKTEVYLQMIEQVLNDGKEVIVLVPEISLTPQMQERFVGRFGDEVAILHSRLSDGERYDEYRKILKKEAHIVVGARSAIFAPFENLGLIVIDEEHEASYKQDSMHPKYHAIEVAKLRSKYHHCPLVLGSATPSLESYARAQKGVYQLLELPKRISNHMPTVTIVSMLDEMKHREFLFSRLLQEKIKERLQRQEQIILLLNRRGYASYILCKDCGAVHKCPNCDFLNLP